MTRRRLRDTPTKTGDGRSPPPVSPFRRLGPRVHRQLAAVDDGEGRLEVLEVDGLGAHEQGVREEPVPRGPGDDADGRAVRGLRADEAVEHVDLAAAQVVAHAPDLAVEELGRAGLVRGAPVDVLRPGLVDDVAVGRRAAGALAGGHDERAVGGEDALPASERPGDELRRREVPVQRTDGDVGGVELCAYCGIRPWALRLPAPVYRAWTDGGGATKKAKAAVRGSDRRLRGAPPDPRPAGMLVPVVSPAGRPRPRRRRGSRPTRPGRPSRCGPGTAAGRRRGARRACGSRPWRRARPCRA